MKQVWRFKMESLKKLVTEIMIQEFLYGSFFWNMMEGMELLLSMYTTCYVSVFHDLLMHLHSMQ